MAEGFEPYHVPQQSRREKLRILQQQQQLREPTSTTSQSLPLYDPSLICSDLLTCHPHHQHPLSSNVVKEENVANLMGFFGSSLDPSSSSSSSAHNHHQHHHHPFLDPVNINPTSIQDINNNHFLYDSQLIFKPEPLSLTHETNSTTTGGGQGLSLSLSSPHSIPLELNLQRYDSAAAINFHHQKLLGGSYVVQGGNMVVEGGSGGGSTSSVPLGPFTGYASILTGSRFLKPAQQLLDEFCNVGSNVGVCADKFVEDHAVLMDPTLENLDGSLASGDAGGENRGKKSRLISMLDEVYKRYKQYYQQMQAVLHSFESVAGLSNAAPYANLALKLMSKQFRCLKAAITDQLQVNNKTHGHLSYGKDETPRPYGNDRGLYGQRRVHSSGAYFDQQPVWRPQRGLPERAVIVLRAWLFEHFLHPYPTDTDKLMLAKQTGLTRSQVSNWFINARVRLWKPMVEEIHMLETRQAQKASQKDERNVNRPSEIIPPSNLHAPENSTSNQKAAQDPPPKRTRNEIPIIPVSGDETMDMSYNHLSSHRHLGVGVGMVGGSSNVSLTLGLHQNNGIGSLEPFPISAAHRFGFDSSEGIVTGGFEAQNRHFGRDIIGGQLLHDFVG